MTHSKTYIQLLAFALFMSGCNTLHKLNYFTSESNVFYVGVENPIFIHSDSKKPIKVTSSVGTVEDNNSSKYFSDTSKYLIYPDTIPGELILTISQGNKKKEIKFRVKPIPNIKAVAFTHTTMYYTTLLSAANYRKFSILMPTITNFDLPCKINLLSYQITRISKNGNIESKTIYDPHSSPNGANYLAKIADSGDVYIFENIEALISNLDEENLNTDES